MRDFKPKRPRAARSKSGPIAASLLEFCIVVLGVTHAMAEPAAIAPVQVSFDADGKTLKLTAYLYRPDEKKWPGARPAIVLLHGRSGVFSGGAKRLDAQTLSSRTKLWGEFWAERGYVGLYVDSFGPRGYPKGFEAGTNKAGLRPPEVNEITVRPHDAMRGLQFLRAQSFVDPRNVFLQGWSNGGSATLSAMHEDTVALEKPSPDTGFRAAIAVYPACRGVARHYGGTYRTYAPLLLLIGTADEEVSFAQCDAMARAARPGDVAFVRYDDATHSYDTPVAKRTAVAANVQATQDTMKRADAFFARHLAPPLRAATPSQAKGSGSGARPESPATPPERAKTAP